MQELNHKLAEIKQEILDGMEQLESSKEVYEFKKSYLDSKKGKIGQLMKEMRNIAPENRAAYGKSVNELKEWATACFEELDVKLKAKELQQRYENEKIDITMPAVKKTKGNLHPITQVRNQLIDVFSSMGFEVFEGTEIETDYYNFTALNTPQDHPARDMQDTFFIEAHPDIVLRTHTSSVQTRVMEVSQPPIRIICPGRVYRNEAISYRAHCFFHQVEALYVDKDVSFTDLKQVLLLFAKEMFGEETKIRLRPSYFPFTEPSAEMDISCNICGGKGCPFCKHTGWVEILGCGMVDPNVLESNGIDSKVYSGYALGMGIERITNLKYQVKDLRMFSENDTRFLKEFEAAY